MLLLPQPKSERSFATFSSLDLDHAAGEVVLVDTSEGALALVALTRLKLRLMVDYQHTDTIGPERLHGLREERDYVPGCFCISLQSRTQRIQYQQLHAVPLAHLECCRERFPS